MKSLFLSLCFICAYLFAVGQEFNQVMKQDIFSNPANAQNQMYINMMNRNKTLDGAEEMTSHPDWLPIEILDKNGFTTAIDSAKYNYAYDQFLFLYQNKLYFLASNKVKTIKMGMEYFTPYSYTFNKEQKSGFFQILVDGDFPLLKRTYLKEVLTNDHPMKLPQANKVHFEKASDLYYLDKKTGVPEKLPKNKKKFINLFRKKQAKLIRFAEEQKISTHDEIDVVRFFQFNKSINVDENQ